MTTPCATCGACCRSYVVPVCGYDVWLICTRQRLAPEQFLVAYRQKDDAREGFQLSAGGPRLGLALDKRGRFRPRAPCVFLMELAGAHARCGIYADRPVVCQSYPMSLWAGVVSERADALCPDDAWPAEEVQRPHWRVALQRLRMHFDVYHEVVARWNARVAAADTRRTFALGEFYSYVLNVYDGLARLDTELGAMALTEVQTTWPSPPHSSSVCAGDGDRPAWLTYFLRARQIIDGFYPEIDAQRPLLLGLAPGPGRLTGP